MFLHARSAWYRNAEVSRGYGASGKHFAESGKQTVIHAHIIP